MKRFDRWVVGLCWCAACALGAALQGQPSPLTYRTSWVGNSFGGGPKWVQNFAEGMFVGADGTVYLASRWDEAGREFGVYRNGDVAGNAGDTHGWGTGGGYAVAAVGQYLFITHSQGNEGGKLKGNQYPDKGYNWYGVARRKLDGSHAPFPGGRGRFNDLLVLRELRDGFDGHLRGLGTDGRRLYISDTQGAAVLVLDPVSMDITRSYSIERPGPLAVDAATNVWVVLSGSASVGCARPNGEFNPAALPLPDGAVPSALCLNARGELMVADAGWRQQILTYSLGATNRLVDQFGEERGVWAGPEPGRVGPTRFCGPTGVGTDAGGNLYVSCNTPAGGTVLRAFSPERKLLWELLGLEFVDVADPVPGSDGQVVYTTEGRYGLDFSKPAGKDWQWMAHTLNPFKYPDDLRLHESHHLQCSPIHRELDGQRFLFIRGMWQQFLSVFRLEGDTAVPCAILSAGPYRAEDGWTPPGQPEKGRWLWRDTNGDGQMQGEEYLPGPGPGGEFWASNVDARGDLWQGDQTKGIWRWRYLGLDAHHVPRYSPEQVETFPMPRPLVNLLRTEYQPETDTMYLTGQTEDRRITGGEWGTAGTVVLRFDHWSGARELRYRAELPYVPTKQLMVSFGVAGGLFFAVDCKSAEVFVYDNQTGKPVGSMKPGPEVHGESGWVDFRDALRVCQRKNGDYAVFVEEDWKGKVLVYHLKDPLRR